MYQDPATEPKRLGADPFIHPTAQVRDSTFGAYCEVGARTKVSVGNGAAIGAGVREGQGAEPHKR